MRAKGWGSNDGAMKRGIADAVTKKHPIATETKLLKACKPRLFMPPIFSGSEVPRKGNVRAV